jgi:O-antigen ligase
MDNSTFDQKNRLILHKNLKLNYFCAMKLSPAIRKIFAISAHPHVIQLIKGIGVIGLFIFAFGIFFKDRTANSGIFLMGTAFVLLLRPLGKSLIKDPLLIFGSIFFLFVSILAVRASIDFDNDQILIVNGMFLNGCVFLLVFLLAFWMHQARGKWSWVFFTIITGYLAQIVRKFDWANFPEVAILYWTGAKRAGFGSSVNRFGLWSAIILLVCALLYKRLWGQSENKFWYGLRIIFWVSMCLISGMGIVFSQSRAAWLASVIIIIPIVFYHLYKTKKIKFKAVALLAIISIAITFLTNLPKIAEQRVLSVKKVYTKIMEGNFDFQADIVADFSSFLERLQLYELFLEKWKERPILGYGPGSSEILLKSVGGHYEHLSRYDHFHNIFLDLLSQLGVVGLILYIGCFFIIIRQLVRGKQHGHLELDYYLVALGGFALIAIAGQFAQPLSATRGLYAFGLLGGIGYAWTFNHCGCDMKTTKYF